MAVFSYCTVQGMACKRAGCASWHAGGAEREEPERVVEWLLGLLAAGREAEGPGELPFGAAVAHEAQVYRMAAAMKGT